MATPTNPESVWARNPGLYEEAVELHKNLGYGEIAALFRARGVDISRSAVRHKLRNRDLGPLVDAGKGAYIPQNLIEPRGGYHVPHVPPQIKHPQGWEPHVEENGDTATAVSEPMETDTPDERTLIEGWKLDPNEWVIVGQINCRRWQAIVPIKREIVNQKEDGTTTRYWATIGYEKKWLHYFRGSLKRRGPGAIAANVKELAAFIHGYKRPAEPLPAGEAAFVVPIADLQAGKGDGDGVTGTTRRMLDAIDRVVDRVRDLRKTGVGLGPLYVFGLGDIVEGCGEFYAQQTFGVQLNRRDQVKLSTNLVLHALKTWSPLFERVVVSAIPGNHGENRKDGKSYTSFSDSDDLAIFEMVGMALAENPAFGHVAFSIPKDELTAVFDVCGTVTGLAHGHAFGKFGDAGKKAQDWWMRQSHGGQPIGKAQLLISGHLHHLLVTSAGFKTHIQCPALEGGSDWFRHMTGQEAAKGLLTLVVGKNQGPAIATDGSVRAGWDHLAVL